jgi:hypothetical protein
MEHVNSRHRTGDSVTVRDVGRMVLWRDFPDYHIQDIPEAM